MQLAMEKRLRQNCFAELAIANRVLQNGFMPLAIAKTMKPFLFSALCHVIEVEPTIAWRSLLSKARGKKFSFRTFAV